MSKDELADWDATAANNLDIGGISIAEGMSPADVNNAFREMMAQLAADYAANSWRDGVDVPGDDLDDITVGGIYFYSSTDANVPAAATGVVAHIPGSTTRAWQIAATTAATAAGDIYWRELSGAGWAAWQQFVHHATTNDFLAITNAGLTVSSTETSVISPTTASYGVSLMPDGQVRSAASNAIAAIIKRSNDGTLLQWYVGTTNVGSVSCSGGVVTYGSFCGSHWSQLRGRATRDIPPGTIMETIDAFCEWEDEKETVLPMVQIAAPGSRAVYGVFSHWDEDGRDMHVASLGAASIRIARGVAVKRGDLIEAGPDGCGVVQADDVYRAGTVAKVTAALKTAGYPDGSYLVPCTLHCG